MHEVQGVVARAQGEPVSIETIHVPDPGPGEALVQVQACGVCHTDLHYREGGINDDFPFLLGHEAAGVVEAVGDGVTSVAPGDFVILNWRAVCGNCRACLRGEPWYCFATHNATQRMTLADGTELSPALGIGAFAEKTLVAAGQCTKVDPSARAAAVAGAPGSTLVHWPAATRVFAANAPMPNAGLSSVPSASVIFWVALCVAKQYQGLPLRQARQRPQTARQFRITKSPGATSVTPSPTASTTPAASCPSRKGKSSLMLPSR
jgi:Zn-dependent alcohol dehydrogenase